MKAARLHEYGQSLLIEDVPAPTPSAGEVVIRVDGAGFCHSDIHVIDGEVRVLPQLPAILGHENAGIVAACGAGVTAVKDGDKVAVFGAWGCGQCDYCVAGEEQLCVRPEWAGLSRHSGGYAEYMLVPHQRHLVPLSTLEPRDAAPLTDAALTPYRAVRKALPFLEPDYFALVIGLGGLGQYGLELLRLLSGCPVIVVDVSEEKLRRAREMGATHTVNGNDPNARDVIGELTRSRGVSAAFDFVGSDATLALAVSTVRSRGKVSHIGLAGGAARMNVLENMRFEVLFEATLWGTIKELREVIAIAESGRLTPIHTEFAPLDQINEVYRRLKSGQVEGRAVITPGS